MQARRFEIRKAQRQQVKVKVALDGPAGSGKTLSALFLAHGLCGDWGKIAIGDTENESALYYAGRTFTLKGGRQVVIPEELNHIDFRPPYHPEAWIELIGQVARSGFEVLILDSISHEWEGEGGCLDMAGGNFNNWARVTPLHRAFIDAMRAAPLHIVATMRSKQEFAMSEKEGPNGRKKAEVVKLGMKASQRENTDYEFGVAFSLEHETHLAKTNKDRTGLFDGRQPFLITRAIGDELARWAQEGTPQTATDADDPDRPEQGQEHPGEPALSALRQEGMRPARATGRPLAEKTSEIDAITPWLRRIQEAEHEGSEERLDAVRTEMNSTLKRRTRGQGEALRRAIDTARAAIRAGRSNGAHPPGPETQEVAPPV